jgi:hypothetical protein
MYGVGVRELASERHVVELVEVAYEQSGKIETRKRATHDYMLEIKHCDLYSNGCS